MINGVFLLFLIGIWAAYKLAVWIDFRSEEIGPDHPEAITGLDVLERTGHHPG